MACRPRGLVLVPTRELATQVQAVLSPLAHAMGLSVAAIFGGTPQNPQVAALRNRADIVVACPGRLADLIGQDHCHLGDVEVSVIDEADHMADLGFLPVVRRLLEATPAEGQRLLFSATLDSAVDVLARRFLTRPARHSVDDASPPAQIIHHLLTVTPADRVAVVATLASGDNRVLIFTRTKHGAHRLARQLDMAGAPAAELHGDLAQGARSRNLAAFGSGEVRVMVATDIAARGIHVDGIDLVIHADPPDRAQGLRAPIGPDRPQRCRRSGGHRADRGAGRRGPRPDAQGGRDAAGRGRRSRLGGAALDRGCPRPGASLQWPRSPARSGGHPGHRPRRRRRIRRFPRPARTTRLKNGAAEERRGRRFDIHGRRGISRNRRAVGGRAPRGRLALRR